VGDKVYILTRHLLHSQTMDPEKQVNKSISRCACVANEWCMDMMVKTMVKV